MIVDKTEGVTGSVHQLQLGAYVISANGTERRDVPIGENWHRSHKLIIIGIAQDAPVIHPILTISAAHPFTFFG